MEFVVILIANDQYALCTGGFVFKSKWGVLLTFFSLIIILHGCKSKEEVAAEQGHALAQHKLGKMYANGEGKKANKVYAYMWFNFSAAQGVESAKISKLALEKLMTSSEIQEATLLAEECVKKRYIDC